MKILELKSFEGVNIFSHYPVIKLTVDLGDFSQLPTREYGDFNSKLLASIPGLQEHYCSRGVPGGFVSRLQEGTYMGHVLEHVILEIQHMAGMEVIYGKTLSTKEENVYEIIFEYKSKEGAIQAAYSALNMVERLLIHMEINVEEEVKKVKETAGKFDLGPSTKAIFCAAKELGIPVTRLGEGSILQMGYGKYQKKVEATITGFTACIGVDIASDKALTKEILAEAGIPVPEGGVARTEYEALEIARKIAGPVVVKPFDGNQGKGVALNLFKEDDILRTFAVAQNYSDRIIVEKYITGRHYRLLVVGDKVVAASERIPAFVEGDGYHNVRELVNITNLNPERGHEHEKPMTKIKIDPVVLMVLAKKGKSLEYVPEKGELVYLRENANISTGGVAVDVTDEVHPDNQMIAIRAAGIVGLDVAGIDLVTENISIPVSPDWGAVIEVNAAPGIRMHHYPYIGQPRNVAKDIVRMLFPKGESFRIPIVSITGTNGKTTTTRMINHILNLKGFRVGMTSTDGIYVQNRLIKKGDTTGPRSARVVLNEPTVDIAVLETARGGIIREGLGYDYSDVGIITNISSDHIGQGGIESLDELAHIKTLVVEAVKNNGYAVLNADDNYVVTMRERVKASVIYFSGVADNIIVRRHLGEGGKAVFIKNGYILFATGNKVRKVASVKAIPATLNGMAVHNTLNALATVSGCIALGLSIKDIRDGLLSFKTDLNDNPGRLNLLNIEGIKVLVDYGHNVAAMHSIIELVKKMRVKKVIGVIGVPGDRSDDNMIDVGFVAGKGFKQIVIKEDADLRGRKSGEVAELLKKGVIKSGLKEDKITIIKNEGSAVKEALLKANPEEMVVVFYEKLEVVMKAIKAAARVIRKRNAYQKSLSGKIKEKTIS